MRRRNARRAAGVCVAGLVVAAQTACTTGAVVGRSATARARATPTERVPVQPSATAADYAEAMRQQIALSGYVPGGPLIQAAVQGDRALFIWPEHNGTQFCVGLTDEGAGWIMCDSFASLPVSAHGLQRLSGPMSAWQMIFSAPVDVRVGSLSCGGTPLEVSWAGTIATATGLRAVYAMTAPWDPQGTLRVELTSAAHRVVVDQLPVGRDTAPLASWEHDC